MAKQREIQYVNAYVSGSVAYQMAQPVSSQLPAEAAAAVQLLRIPAQHATLHAHADVPLRAVYAADTRAYIDRRVQDAGLS